MSLPTISNTFRISTRSEDPIDIRARDNDGAPSKVAVDLYCDQSVSKDDDYRFASYSAMFFGRQAKQVANHFQPGDLIRVDGQLRIKRTDNAVYVNIRQAEFQFPASPPEQKEEHSTPEASPPEKSNRAGGPPTTPPRPGR